jgi:hypothetical protein
MKTPIRFAIWIWNRGIDDFVTSCLPSILQPNNIPWLIRNGYPVALDFYTISWSAEVIQRLAGSLETQLRGLADGADVTTTMFVIDAAPGSYELKTSFFKTLVRRGIDAQSHGLFVFADMYYGDGSIRNIVTYGQKPRVTVSGLYLRVKRARFSELLDRHHAATGGTTISNARLVDIAFDCLIDGMKASIVDDDRNASYSTSGSIRRITDELYTYTFHAPTPILFFFEEQDAKFFARFDWNVYLLDHIWPSMLIAQNRWRVMASSDLFFLAELNAAELETDVHTHPTKPGMRYNDEYGHEHLNGRVHQTLLMTLRRERLAETTTA